MVTTNRFNVREIALINGPEQMQMVTIMSASHPMYVIKENEKCRTIDTRIQPMYVPITKATQITLTHHSFYKDSMTSSFEVGDTAVYNGGGETFIRGKIVNADHPNYCLETIQGERIFTTEKLLRQPAMADVTYLMQNEKQLRELDEFQHIIQTAKTAGQFAGAIIDSQAIHDRIQDAISSLHDEQEQDQGQLDDASISKMEQKIDGIMDDINNSRYEPDTPIKNETSAEMNPEQIVDLTAEETKADSDQKCESPKTTWNTGNEGITSKELTPVMSNKEEHTPFNTQIKALLTKETPETWENRTPMTTTQKEDKWKGCEPENDPTIMALLDTPPQSSEEELFDSSSEDETQEDPGKMSTTKNVTASEEIRPLSRDLFAEQPGDTQVSRAHVNAQECNIILNTPNHITSDKESRNLCTPEWTDNDS